MKCQVKPDLDFVPSLEAKFFLSSFGREEGRELGGRGCRRSPTVHWLLKWHPMGLCNRRGRSCYQGPGQFQISHLVGF